MPASIVSSESRRYSNDVTTPKFPPTSDTPQQFRMLRGTGAPPAAPGGHEVQGPHVVAGQTAATHQEAVLTAERQSGNPGRPDYPTCRGQPECRVSWSNSLQMTPASVRIVRWR